MGAALIFPATLSIITNVFTDPTERQRAIAVWAGTAGIGIALGPLTGGLLLEHFYWGSIFWVNLPIIAVALVGLWLVVPESRDPEHRRLDPLGAALSVAGLGAARLRHHRGGSDGWLDAITLATLAGGAGGARAVRRPRDAHAVAAARRARVPQPPLHRGERWRWRRPTSACSARSSSSPSTCRSCSATARSPPGIRTVPFAVTLLVVANLTPRIVARTGPRWPIVAGSVIVAVSQLPRIASTPDTGYDLILLSQTLFALGMGLMVAPATASIMGSLPPGRAGVGSAMNDTARQVGGALGVAVMGSLAAAGYRAGLDDRVAAEALPSGALTQARESLAGALSLGDGAVAEAGRAAFISGLRWASAVAVLVALAGAAAAWRLLPGPATAPVDAPVDEPARSPAPADGPLATSPAEA